MINIKYVRAPAHQPNRVASHSEIFSRKQTCSFTLLDTTRLASTLLDSTHAVRQVYTGVLYKKKWICLSSILFSDSRLDWTRLGSFDQCALDKTFVCLSEILPVLSGPSLYLSRVLVTQISLSTDTILGPGPALLCDQTSTFSICVRIPRSEPFQNPLTQGVCV
jgi:hypothetical protein